MSTKQALVAIDMNAWISRQKISDTKAHHFWVLRERKKSSNLFCQKLLNISLNVLKFDKHVQELSAGRHRRPSYLLADRWTLAVDLHNTLRILLNCVNKFVNKFRTLPRFDRKWRIVEKLDCIFPLIRQKSLKLKKSDIFLISKFIILWQYVRLFITGIEMNEYDPRFLALMAFGLGWSWQTVLQWFANQNIQLQPIHKLYNKYCYTINYFSRRCELRYVMIFPQS